MTDHPGRPEADRLEGYMPAAREYLRKALEQYKIIGGGNKPGSIRQVFTAIEQETGHMMTVVILLKPEMVVRGGDE